LFHFGLAYLAPGSFSFAHVLTSGSVSFGRHRLPKSSTIVPQDFAQTLLASVCFVLSYPLDAQAKM